MQRQRVVWGVVRLARGGLRGVLLTTFHATLTTHPPTHATLTLHPAH